MGGKRLKVSVARPQGAPKPQGQYGMQQQQQPQDLGLPNNLYISGATPSSPVLSELSNFGRVAGLPLNWEKEQLQKLVEPFGVVSECRVLHGALAELDLSKLIS